MNWENMISSGLGALLGGGLVSFYTVFKKHQIEKNRKNILLVLLKDKKHVNGWRKLETLSKVIGLDDEGTKNLLVEIGARGSLQEKEVWGLISKHPLDEDNIS